MDATTLPPRELKNTMRRNFSSELPALRKSTKAWGVSDSITPSATMTCGQRAPQPAVSNGSTRKVIEPDSARTAVGPSDPNRGSTNAIAATRQEQRRLVGGDGLEPPTLSA